MHPWPDRLPAREPGAGGADPRAGAGGRGGGRAPAGATLKPEASIPTQSRPDAFPLAEVLAALSLATDLADGHPMEKALRTTLLATSLGARLGLDPVALSDTYYTGLLRYLGCTAYAPETARALGGDDNATRSLYAAVDFERPAEVVGTTLRGLARDAAWPTRAAAVASFFLRSSAISAGLIRAHCEVAAHLARRLGMSDGVARGLEQMHERWDGRGAPSGLTGEAIAVQARLVHFAHVVEILHRQGGREAALAVVAPRSRGDFDPRVAAVFLDAADELLRLLEDGSVWDPVLEAEPRPARTVPLAALDPVAEAFADFADLKSLATLGHSTGVAAIAEEAARLLGLDAVLARRGALLHDLGSVAVPSGVWGRPRALTAPEWDRVRLHAYFTETVLQRSGCLAPIARIAGRHHERLDGSGYHRGSAGEDQPPEARLLAAADHFQALLQERPHRAALDAASAAAALNAEAKQGRLGTQACEAVLAAWEGRPLRRPATAPAGLSEREVEVLRLVAAGLTNPQIGRALRISRRTAQHHVIHIYRKIGRSTRAGAALFAREHHLLDPD